MNAESILDHTEAHVAGSLWDPETNQWISIRDIFTAVWRAGQRAGWDDRHEDEVSPLPAGALHDTPCPFVATAVYDAVRRDLGRMNG